MTDLMSKQGIALTDNSSLTQTALSELVVSTKCSTVAPLSAHLPLFVLSQIVFPHKIRCRLAVCAAI